MLFIFQKKKSMPFLLIVFFSEPPGPIDNSGLLMTNDQGETVLIPRSNYSRIPRELYLLFVNCYGGGPEVSFCAVFVSKKRLVCFVAVTLLVIGHLSISRPCSSPKNVIL